MIKFRACVHVVKNTILETNFLESLHITNLGDYAGFFKLFPAKLFYWPNKRNSLPSKL